MIGGGEGLLQIVAGTAATRRERLARAFLTFTSVAGFLLHASLFLSLTFGLFAESLPLHPIDFLAFLFS
jgi:hypothetical protein